MNNSNLINLKENATHGSFILPFTTYNGEISETYSFIPIHWHEEMEITLIEKGKSTYKIDLNSYILEEGDLLIIKPFALHSVNQFNDINMKWNTMVFNLNMLNSAVTDGCLIKYFAPILNNEHELPLIINQNSKGYTELLAIIAQIFDCYSSKQPAFELELKSLLYHFFCLLYKYNLVAKNKKVPISNEVISRIKNALNYIHENYKKELSVKDIADNCNLSEYHFMRFFKQHIGMTCIEYINTYRLEAASKMLSEADKSVMEISFEAGFNNVSYFNKLFKNRYKLTPKEFQKINKNT